MTAATTSIAWSDAVNLSWAATAGASGYDVVRGSLALLQSTGGDFSMSLPVCLENDGARHSSARCVVAQFGHGFFYLVRVTPGGTYDSGCPGQAASYDLDLMGSPCP